MTTTSVDDVPAVSAALQALDVARQSLEALRAEGVRGQLALAQIEEERKAAVMKFADGGSAAGVEAVEKRQRQLAWAQEAHAGKLAAAEAAVVDAERSLFVARCEALCIRQGAAATAGAALVAEAIGHLRALADTLGRLDAAVVESQRGLRALMDLLRVELPGGKQAFSDWVADARLPWGGVDIIREGDRIRGVLREEIYSTLSRWMPSAVSFDRVPMLSDERRRFVDGAAELWREKVPMNMPPGWAAAAWDGAQDPAGTRREAADAPSVRRPLSSGVIRHLKGPAPENAA